jgi:hypothetical protein
MVVEQIYIKMKPKDIIKFVIGQFDLIMGQMKV